MMHKETPIVAVCHTMKNPRAQPVHLMDDLMIEIRSWLPVKSLLRFRCVSKSWSSLIFDPSFVKLHLLRSPKHANLLLASTIDHLIVMFCPRSSFLENPSFAYPLLEGEEGSILLDNRYTDRYSLIGSCNGLVCFYEYFHRPPGKNVQYWLRFWNPATRLTSKKSPYFLTKVFSTVFGFGYAKSSDAYKVVALLRRGYLPEHDLDGIQVKVYTMGDHHWRDIQPFPAFPLVGSMINIQGTFVSGTLNWLARQNYRPGDNLFEVAIDQIVIVSLDLEKETYEQFLLPNGLDEVPQNYLAVLMDCLCLCHDYKLTHFVVWQMLEFGVEKSWTQFVKVSYHHLRIPIPIYYNYCSMLPMCISENGDALMLREIGYEWKILYNRRHNTVEHSHNKPIKKRTSTDVCDYAPSLVLPY